MISNRCVLLFHSIQDCLERHNNIVWFLWSVGTTLPPDAWRTHDDDDCMTWDEWQDTKRTSRIVGPVLTVVGVLLLVSGIAVAVFKRKTLCKCTPVSTAVTSPAVVVGGVGTMVCVTALK